MALSPVLEIVNELDDRQSIERAQAVIICIPPRLEMFHSHFLSRRNSDARHGSPNSVRAPYAQHYASRAKATLCRRAAQGCAKPIDQTCLRRSNRPVEQGKLITHTEPTLKLGIP